MLFFFLLTAFRYIEHKPPMHEIRTILALGFAVRHIVCSGWRAGYEMYDPK